MHSSTGSREDAVLTAGSLDDVLGTAGGADAGLCVLNFWAAWAEPCVVMNEVFRALAEKHRGAALFWDVDAETVADVSLHFRVEAVPTFVLVRGGREIGRVNGAKAEELVDAVEDALSGDEKTAAATAETVESRLAALVRQHRVMVFIKGTPEAPRCGFTAQLLSLLDEHAVEYDYFDILSDETVRSGLKAFSDWPTYPQIYVGGEFLGGLDIFRDMAAAGQLEELLAAQPSPHTRQ